eukprot:CAMPEP_0181320442 /NCGR_PEP_ID=MMETSP1101-20121128/18127_1 /TAXON_ID=46948 /ORGANISM="Rhodomonas abbreviata, Strain Caron Lab Isolate" /LENGTH=154 /DNA_ID=CAMNT_0023428149 /DNA_START=160 /DNA_END=621 /DNA_ORIENTATION=-
MDAAGEAFQSLLGGNARELSLREQIEEATAAGEGCCSLTYEERIIGFIGCVGAGLFLNCFSLVRLTELLLGNPTPFAVCFTLGNLLSLGSMSFLIGPARQLRNLTKGRRALPTAVYVCMMLCTLFVAFTDGLTHLERVVLILGCLILQFIALAW